MKFDPALAERENRAAPLVTLQYRLYLLCKMLARALVSLRDRNPGFGLATPECPADRVSRVLGRVGFPNRPFFENRATKIRELIQDLKATGWRQVSGGVAPEI